MDVERFVSIEEATYQIGTIRAKKRDRLIEEETKMKRKDKGGRICYEWWKETRAIFHHYPFGYRVNSSIVL